MSQRIYIGFDLGTSVVKIGAFTEEGLELGITRLKAPEIGIDPEIKEFDGTEFTEIVFEGLEKLLSYPRIRRENISGMSIASQAQTFLLADCQGNLLRPAVSWLDKRGLENVDDVNSLLISENLPKVELMASVLQLIWLKQNEKDKINKTGMFFTLGGYLNWLMTGRNISEIRAAQSTGLYSEKKSGWIKSLLNKCGIAHQALPKVMQPGEFAGIIKPNIAKKFGLSPEISFAVGVHDQMAAVLGLANVFSGCLSISLGTATAAVISSDRKIKLSSDIFERPHPVQSLHAALSFSKQAGDSLQSFCQRHHISLNKIDFNELSLNADNYSNDENIKKGLIEILNNLAIEVRKHKQLLEIAAGPVKSIRICGGRAQLDILIQLIADTLDFQIERPDVIEPGCLGAAILAVSQQNPKLSLKQIAMKIYKPKDIFYPRQEKALLHAGTTYANKIK